MDVTIRLGNQRRTIPGVTGIKAEPFGAFHEFADTKTTKTGWTRVWFYRGEEDVVETATPLTSAPLEIILSGAANA